MFRKLFFRRKPIYIITTIVDFKIDEFYNSNDVYMPTGMRSPVYRHSLKSAMEVVETNMGDICECCYNYALIEEVPPYIYPTPIKRWWYKWDNDKKVYVPIQQPYNLGDSECPCSFIIG